MGLIKTAIFAGAGLYAVNRIAKVADNKHNQQAQYQQQPQYNNGYPNQQFPQQQQQGQFQPQQSSRSQDEYYRGFDGQPPAYNQRQHGFIEGEVPQSNDFASQAMEFLSSSDSKGKRSKSQLSGLFSK